MSESLEVSLELVNQKVRFTGKARNNEAIHMDYFPPYGDGEGYTGLELLLMSLAVCSATSITGLLRVMKKEVSAFSVHASGEQKEDHPKGFSKIHLSYSLKSPDASETDLHKAIQVSEEKLCPVWSMLKGSVSIEADFTLKREE